MVKNRLLKILATLATDRFGNLGMTAAVAIPALLAAIGIALDYMAMVNQQRVLQDGMDAAAVSTAASLVAGTHTETTAPAYAMSVLMASIGDDLGTAEKNEIKNKLSVKVKTTTTTGKRSYEVKLSGGFTVALSPFSGLTGHASRPVAATSSTEGDYTWQTAMSMYLVLDRSGSMSFATDTVDDSQSQCQNYSAANWGYYPNLPISSPCYVNKASALKKAAAALFDELDELEDKDHTDKVIRVGGVSFTDSMQMADAMSWSTSNVRNYVSSLPSYPTGGTDMTDGMDLAYQTLNDAAETAAQAAKGNMRFQKFIVLMTDGENTGASNIWNPNLDAETLATCDAARSAGITIFTVAFMAPANGEALLKSCAGVDSNFYAASDMQSLIDAFADIGTRAAEKATRITN
jgi:Flp pilus assembly protein TadG/uncharacterized protein YegL